MDVDLEVLAIIPARGGSKSIPRKNVKPLAGHPLLAWSVAAALQAASVTDVLVSTDDEEMQFDADARRGRAARGVEHVCGQARHRYRLRLNPKQPYGGRASV